MLVVCTDFSFFSFKQEDIVKLQILNLGAKLFITNPKQVGDITILMISSYFMSNVLPLGKP